jgi:Tol biopolymer transport system component
LPDLPIVFQRNDFYTSQPELGFINEDGQDLSFRTVNTEVFPSIYSPVWIAKNRTIAFRNIDRDILHTISEAGYLTGYGEIYHFSGVLSPIENSSDVIVVSGDENAVKIQRINFSNSRDAETYLSIPRGKLKIMIGNHALSQNFLVYLHDVILNSTTEDMISEIILLNVETQESQILASEKGNYYKTGFFAPSISPNGKWVVYTASDGLYLINLERNSSHCIVKAKFNYPFSAGDTWVNWRNLPPIPSWSPDSQWIVYHRCMLPLPTPCKNVADFNIYKVNIETGEEILLVEGGLNPYWRLTPAEETQAP